MQDLLPGSRGISEAMPHDGDILIQLAVGLFAETKINPSLKRSNVFSIGALFHVLCSILRTLLSTAIEAHCIPYFAQVNH